MKKRNNLISIIVPCYNVEKYIKRCIESIKKQTYTNFEALLIDDGSKDNTKKIIKSLIKDDDRFKYYYKENGGQASARNYGLDIVKGEFIAFVDSDDWLENNYLEELYNALINKDVDVSICNIRRVYSNKISINKVNDFNTINCLYPAPWNKLYKKSVFKDIRFPDRKLYEDLNAISKVILTFSYTIIDKELYNYAINEGSTMHICDNRIYDVYDMILDIEKYAKDKKINLKVYDNLEFINIYHILIGTIYRASFTEDFCRKTIKKISIYVNKKYPNWFKNQYIEKLPFTYRLYLFMLRLRLFGLIYLMLKIFGKKVHL